MVTFIGYNHIPSPPYRKLQRLAIKIMKEEWENGLWVMLVTEFRWTEISQAQ
jgi:hypothetical protein